MTARRPPARPLVCALVACGSTDRVRLYVIGARCAAHTPSAQAGLPEPDELLTRHRQTLARLTSTDTDTDTERTAA
ncbi:hypothetical protein [Actinocrinis sp.]|uniref:hypothetical protein n=1 Tax=Actinocrinis sp. TaxID=1920516 RepID=UPI002D578806|nr:hypothetical protein [Actinocrinis sp.]HZP54979.1 hypothetical protein [Actinocrinis sp.]